MNNLSTFEWFGYKLPKKELYQLIKQVGFDGVMLWWGEMQDDLNLEKHKNPDRAREQGLFIENVHAPFHGASNLWLDNIEGQDYAERINSSIEDCAIHEIPTIVAHVSCREALPLKRKVGLNRLKKIVDTAEKKGINIAIENLRRPEYFEYIFGNIKSERLKFCFDSGHQNCRTPDYDFLSQYKDKLIAIHLHDNDGKEDQHLLPYDGTTDWGKIMRRLKEIDYKGYISLEAANLGYENLENNPLAFLNIAYGRAKRLQGIYDYNLVK